MVLSYSLWAKWRASRGYLEQALAQGVSMGFRFAATLAASSRCDGSAFSRVCVVAPGLRRSGTGANGRNSGAGSRDGSSLHSSRHPVRVCLDLLLLPQPALAQVQAEEAMAFSQRYGFRGWWAASFTIEGWRWLSRQVETGIAHIYEGLAAQQAMDARLFRPAFLSLLAETYGQAEQPEQGLRLLDEA